MDVDTWLVCEGSDGGGRDLQGFETEIGMSLYIETEKERKEGRLIDYTSTLKPCTRL